MSLGNKRAVSSKDGFGECALVPVFVPGGHANIPSFRFFVPGNIRVYPRSGFRSGGTSAKPNHPFGKPPFYQPPKMSANERKRAQKNAKERFRLKFANNQVPDNQVWELLNMFLGLAGRVRRGNLDKFAVHIKVIFTQSDLFRPTCPSRPS